MDNKETKNKQNTQKANIQAVHTPLEHGKKTIEDILKENESRLKALNYISEISIKYNQSECKLPVIDNFFSTIWNRSFLISKMKTKLKVKLGANFVVIDAKEATLIYNDKSGKKPLRFYIVTLMNANGRIEKNIEIANNSKSDFKEFQTHINSLYNDFAVNLKEAEFKTYVAEFISPNVASTVKIYTNAGVTPDGDILYENALATKNGIIWADEDGYIKTGHNTYVKIAEATHYLPKLSKSTKSGQTVANELMTNIEECWSEDIILPLLTLGHMVMSIYYDKFIKHYGCPSLILYGGTGSGKSTLAVVGLSIFGLSKEGLTSGGSTAKSNEYFCSKYNCLNVCIDDLKENTLNSETFEALIKGAYKSVPRTRQLPYGRGVEYIHTCSPASYSTNKPLPDLREFINRLNVISIFDNVFKPDKFKYHELETDKLAELSLILPEFLKFEVKDVLSLYSKVFEIFKQNVQDTQKRVVSNIAYAYTGALLLTQISGVEFENLQEKAIKYAQEQVIKYENIETPVERLLNSLIVLHQLKLIEPKYHYKIIGADKTENNEVHIRFFRRTLIDIYNNHYRYDKKKHIDEKTFGDYLAKHKRNRTKEGGISVRYEGQEKPQNSVEIDITDIDELRSLGGLYAIPADEFFNKDKGNKM